MDKDPNHLITTLLRLLLRGCHLSPVRTAANLLCLNRPLFPRKQVVREVCQAVSTHYREHRLEAAFVAKQARTYQRIYFRQAVRHLREELQQDSAERAPRRQALLDYYLAQDAELKGCDDSDAVIRHLARYYAEDMAADLNAAFFFAFKHIARRLFPHFVRSIQASGEHPTTLQRVREVAAQAPLLFVPNHISNADHIPICFALNGLGIRQPRIAAGANLFRGVSSQIMPHVNAYKIRREHIGAGSSWLANIRWFQNPIYRKTHSEYLRRGWDHGESLLFYIEGTRSRDGTIGKPKLGILGEAMEYVRSTGAAFYLVPIALSYTVVPEDREIEASRSGADISQRDIITQLAALDRSYRSFDRAPIHVRFADPIPLVAEEAKVEEVAQSCLQRIKAGVCLTDTSAVAACILAAAEADTTGAVERQQVRSLWRQNFSERDEFADGDGTDRHLDSGLKTLTARGFIAPDGAPERYLLLEEPLLRQYANRIQHRMATPAHHA